jgi:hypothetical protein
MEYEHSIIDLVFTDDVSSLYIVVSNDRMINEKKMLENKWWWPNLRHYPGI